MAARRNRIRVTKAILRRSGARHRNNTGRPNIFRFPCWNYLAGAFLPDGLVPNEGVVCTTATDHRELSDKYDEDTREYRVMPKAHRT